MSVQTNELVNEATTTVTNDVAVPAAAADTAVAAAPAAVEEVVEEVEEVLPADVITLSSGVRVRINPVPQRFLTEGMISIFKEAKLDSEGNIITDDNISNQLKLADNIQHHHATLLSFGVELYGSISDYLGTAVPTNWLNMLKRSGLDLSDFDLNDSSDREYLFLKNFAFVSDGDWALLNEKAVGQ